MIRINCTTTESVLESVSTFGWTTTLAYMIKINCTTTESVLQLVSTFRLASSSHRQCNNFFFLVGYLDPCASNPCLNGGVCTKPSDPSADMILCQCPNGYVGVRCEIIDTGKSLPHYISHLSWLILGKMKNKSL